MNPFMTKQRGFIIKESARAEFTAQFFVCEQTNRINDRRTPTAIEGNPTGASRPHPRLPGGRDISFTPEYRGSERSRLPSFAISLSVVPTMLGNATEVRRQNESTWGSL